MYNNSKLYRVSRKIRSFYRKPYKMFMFHFAGRNSIDGRNINEEELKWCLDYEKKYAEFDTSYSFNHQQIKKMFEMYQPYRLI